MGKNKKGTKKGLGLPGPKPPKVKAVNPFTLHHNRKKFSIVGQSKKGSVSIPTVSRQRAMDNVRIFHVLLPVLWNW